MNIILHEYETVTSTNDVLRQLAEAGAPEGTVVLAHAQTAGRGRQGRQFHSPEGTGLYFSMLLCPEGKDVLSVTPMAAVAASEAIERVAGRRPEIKWVNDLLLDGRKVCGILAESKFSGAGTRPDYVILGIGINLLAPEGGFPGALREIAGAVFPAGTDVQRAYREMADVLAERLCAGMEGLAERAYLEAYKAGLCVLKRPVVVCEGGVERSAEAIAVDDDLRLLVRYEDGEEAWRSTGEIRVRMEN